MRKSNTRSKYPTRIIKKNNSISLPREALFVDVESEVRPGTDNREYFALRLWVACYVYWYDEAEKRYEEWRWGTDADSFWDFVEEKATDKTKLRLVSHHIEPDFIPLDFIAQLRKRGWTIEYPYNKGFVTIVPIVKDRKKLCIVNNANIFPGKLEVLGKMVGLDKFEIDFTKCTDEELLRYCKRDVEIVVELWDKRRKYLREEDLGAWRDTLAGQALTTWRHRFMKYSVKIHSSPEVLELEREAYHGGRVEALYYGEVKGEEIYYIDVNSMYGWIERNCELPRSLYTYYKPKAVDEIGRLLENYCLIARVTLELDEQVFPYKIEDKIRYPVGRFSTVLTTAELSYAYERGWIKNCDILVVYNKAKIFEDFADYFLKKRIEYKQRGDKVNETICKNMLNMLYGKFGARGTEIELVGECPPDEFGIELSFNAQTEKHIRYFRSGGKMYVVSEDSESFYTFVAIAAHVTAYGRMYIYDIMKKCGLDNVYHVATDGLITNAGGLKNVSDMVDAAEPGKLKVEYLGDEIVIYGKNEWVAKGKKKLKGIQDKAPEVGEGIFVNTNWPRLGRFISKELGSPYFVEKVTKTLHREDFHNFKGSRPVFKVYET